MHVCETHWSGSDWADRKDFIKINGAAPADPLGTLGTHDTLSRAPIWTFHGRVVVFAARAHGVCSELMVNAQLIRSKHILDLPIFDACFYEAVFLHSVALLFWPTVESISNKNYIGSCQRLYWLEEPRFERQARSREAQKIDPIWCAQFSLEID